MRSHNHILSTLLLLFFSFIRTNFVNISQKGFIQWKEIFLKYCLPSIIDQTGFPFLSETQVRNHLPTFVSVNLILKYYSSFLNTYKNISIVLWIMNIFTICCLLWVLCTTRDQSRYVPSQWETLLQCNDISHWLGTHLDWSLYCHSLSLYYLCLHYYDSQISPFALTFNTHSLENCNFLPSVGCNFVIIWKQHLNWTKCSMTCPLYGCYNSYMLMMTVVSLVELPTHPMLNSIFTKKLFNPLVWIWVPNSGFSIITLKFHKPITNFH